MTGISSTYYINMLLVLVHLLWNAIGWRAEDTKSMSFMSSPAANIVRILILIVESTVVGFGGALNQIPKSLFL